MIFSEVLFVEKSPIPLLRWSEKMNYNNKIHAQGVLQNKYCLCKINRFVIITLIDLYEHKFVAGIMDNGSE